MTWFKSLAIWKLYGGPEIWTVMFRGKTDDVESSITFVVSIPLIEITDL